MRPEHQQIVDQFGPEIQHYILEYFGLSPGGFLRLSEVLVPRHYGQADVVLALLRGGDSLTRGAAEALVGRPIAVLPPRTLAEVPKLPPAPEVAAADRRRVLSVVRNPR